MGIGYTVEVRRDIATADIGELSQNAVVLAWSAETFPAKSEIESQAGSHFPVVHSEHGVVVGGVMAIRVRFSAAPRVNRRLHKIGIIPRKISVSLVGDIGDGAVRLPGSIRCGSYNGATCPAVSGYVGEVPKLVVARETQIPVTVKDAVCGSAPELEGMVSHRPCHVVLQPPTILNEGFNLFTFEGAKRVGKAARRLIVNSDLGSRLFGGISFGERIKETVMRKVHFVEQARIEGMRFDERQIVRIDDN